MKTTVNGERRWVAIVVSTLILSGCFVSVKPIYNDKEQAKAVKGVERFHTLQNEGRFEEIYALLADTTQAQLTKEQFLVAEQQVTNLWGKVQATNLSEAKVLPGPPVEVRMIYNTKFEKGDGQEWFIWNTQGDEARLMVYEPKPGFDKPDVK